MKALVFVTLACLLTVPAVAADAGPASVLPCAVDDVACWYEYVVSGGGLFPLCQYQDEIIQEVCNALGPD